MIDLSEKRVMVTGGMGFLGRKIVESLYARGCSFVGFFHSSEFDLRKVGHVQEALEKYQPDIVIHAAGHAGGIGLNQKRPAELFYDNALMGIQLIHWSLAHKVEKFVQIGTICEYPKFTTVPFQEEELWDGFPEQTNSAYGVSKKSLLVMGQAYRQQYGFNVIHLLPVNLYGPGDNFEEDSSHVIPALIRKFHKANQENLPNVTIWGSGKASREFLYVDDAAQAVVRATESYDEPEPINIGAGFEIKISSLVELISQKMGYRGDIIFDTTMPDGQPHRCLDVSKAKEKMGWEAQTKFEDGLDKTIKWYLTNQKERGNVEGSK